MIEWIDKNIQSVKKISSFIWDYDTIKQKFLKEIFFTIIYAPVV